MVGVPGRSKGCLTCVKRRIKCDEARPTCKRCEKAGYVCKGYERALQLRFYTGGKQSESTTAVTNRIDNNGAADASLDPVLRTHGRGHSPEVPRELSLVAFREEIQFSFLFENFVWSGYGTPWLQMVAAGRLDVLSLEACRAFSLSVFGRHHHQPQIEGTGAVHYDRTVRALSSRLQHVGSPGSEALIIPIAILLMQSVGHLSRLSAACLQN